MHSFWDAPGKSLLTFALEEAGLWGVLTIQRGVYFDTRRHLNRSTIHQSLKEGLERPAVLRPSRLEVRIHENDDLRDPQHRCGRS